MALNIKNEEACRLAREVAQAEGISMTEAVIEALRDRARKSVDRQAKYERLMAIGRDAAARTTAEWKATNWDEVLYDENGLPR